jgi:Fe-Mn family superoxide dismutase
MKRTQEINRRDFIVGAATVAGAMALPLGAFAEAEKLHASTGTSPRLVKVPNETDIKKALSTVPKGISEATHKAHLGLWQGYANKTNEIRKLLAALDTDPKKGNPVYSETRALKVNYAFAYGGYKNHNVYFDTIG